MRNLIRWMCDPTIDLLLVGVVLFQLAVGGAGDPESAAEADRRAPSASGCGCSHDEDPDCAAWKEVASCYVPAKEDRGR